MYVEYKAFKYLNENRFIFKENKKKKRINWSKINLNNKF